MAFNIRCIPDLFTGESFNIGVCVVGPDGSQSQGLFKGPAGFRVLGEMQQKGIVQLARMSFRFEAEMPSNAKMWYDTPTPVCNLTLLAADAVLPVK